MKTKMSEVRKARIYREFALNMLEDVGEFTSPISEWGMIRDQPCDDDCEQDAQYLVVTPKDTFQDEVSGVDNPRFIKF